MENKNKSLWQHKQYVGLQYISVGVNWCCAR